MNYITFAGKQNFVVKIEYIYIYIYIKYVLYSNVYILVIQLYSPLIKAKALVISAVTAIIAYLLTVLCNNRYMFPVC